MQKTQEMQVFYVFCFVGFFVFEYDHLIRNEKKDLI